MKILSRLSDFYYRLDRKKLWIIWTANILWIVLLFSYIWCLDSYAATWEDNIPTLSPLDCKSAVLMEAETGRILYEQNADESLPPASVTKVMTLLLTMEAIEKGNITLDQMLTASDHAASMGGTQVFLEVGEQMSVEDLLKSVIIASANDAAVVLAEAIAGSEESFVSMMNNRASELGMQNTHFENTNGLDDTVTDHVTSARDISLMSRELIRHEKILEYSSIWMDTVRNGEFGLTNTNRLVRFYKGATGLKTGSTSKAKFCISATAKRDGMHLIAVIMGAPTRDIRNAEATKLLDWGFANYSLYKYDPCSLGEVKLLGSNTSMLECKTDGISLLVPKGTSGKITSEINLPESVKAPLSAGEQVGNIVFKLDGEEIGKAKIVSSRDANPISFAELFFIMLQKFILW
ncbi:MAG: D-alanyl-D-alanine carboxypeptidase [Clostridia bacterium]|nr:D-alanyl-D-alanine carboxypeptidase [Clostridia bacterium]